MLFLIGQSFGSEPHEDSLLCFQEGQLIFLGLSQVPDNNRHNSCFDESRKIFVAHAMHIAWIQF